VYGDQVMAGYWNNPAETGKVKQDGWLFTGDIGRFDQAGYLYLLDRKKDMILVNGANVYCTEVEHALQQHPFIRETAVVGIPLPVEGQAVAAVVVPVAHAQLELPGIRDYLQDRLAVYKQPTILLIVDALPRTIIGKVDKNTLRQWLLTAC
jgi:long-chain acyl-CoA synthetase